MRYRFHSDRFRIEIQHGTRGYVYRSISARASGRKYKRDRDGHPVSTRSISRLKVTRRVYKHKRARARALTSVQRSRVQCIYIYTYVYDLRIKKNMMCLPERHGGEGEAAGAKSIFASDAHTSLYRNITDINSRSFVFTSGRESELNAPAAAARARRHSEAGIRGTSYEPT